MCYYLNVQFQGQRFNTAYGTVTLCKGPSGMQVEQKLLDLHTGRSLTDSDYTSAVLIQLTS